MVFINYITYIKQNLLEMKTLRFIGMLLCAVLLSVSTSSCGDDDEKDGIVGVWVDGSDTLKLGSDGSYKKSSTDGQYRVGEYSYNASQKILSVSIKAVPGLNGAYKQTFIVQTLSASTLVLLYTDGDVEGYYTRKKNG